MKNVLSFLGGVGIGVAVMYLFDPTRGTRRRDLAREQLRRGAKRFSDTLQSTARQWEERNFRQPMPVRTSEKPSPDQSEAV